MSEILTRLRGYNPPDRTIDTERTSAQDISDAADEIERLRLALETATREAEEERRTAEAAVKFLGRIAEVTWEAGLPSGDREQTLANVRALASRPAPPADAAREAKRRCICGCEGDPFAETLPASRPVSAPDANAEAVAALDQHRRFPGPDATRLMAHALETVLRSSPAPAPPADAPPLPPECTHDPSLVCLRCRVVIPMPAPPADAAREAEERPVLSVHSMHDTCDLCQRDIPDGCYAVFCGTCEDRLRDALSPAPAPSAKETRS